MKRIFQITDKNVGDRLDRFLYSEVGTVSRMFLTGLICNNLALVNGAPAPAGYKLKTGDRIEIEIDETAVTAMTPENIPLDVLFEDAEILVINKPAEMLVHPSHQIKTGTLANALAFHLNNSQENAEAGEDEESETQNPKFKNVVRPGLVHRLDKQTSGLMVVAKTERALRILSSHFERKLVEKRYLAVVSGEVIENSGRIIAPIGRVAGVKPYWQVVAGGKESETNFRVIEKRSETTLLELEPVTGRTNQLRIHCAHAGFPIVGDKMRGGRENARLCLHAARLSFYHPNGGWLAFESESPPEFHA